MNSENNISGVNGQNIRTFAKDEGKKETGANLSGAVIRQKTEPTGLSIAAANKKQLNASILESSLKFNSSVGDKPLSLVLKTALEGINNALKEMGVETKVEDAYQASIDFTPEATAQRIVSFSTNFLSKYQEQNPQMDRGESITKFMEIITKGVDQGFGEARDVLKGVNALEGDIATNIDKTYELVLSGLESFAENESSTKDKPEKSSS